MGRYYLTLGLGRGCGPRVSGLGSFGFRVSSCWVSRTLDPNRGSLHPYMALHPKTQDKLEMIAAESLKACALEVRELRQTV